MPNTFTVYRNASGHYLILELGCYLMYHPMYPEVETPEVMEPTNTKMMHGALYDLVQCDERIGDRDEFVTPHGLFRVYGVHVEQVFELKSEAKARRARLRRLAKKQAR